MIRIVTASTHAALLADREELGRTRSTLDLATDARDRALTDLADARTTARTLTGTIGSLRAELDQAREDTARAARRATDAETGTQALVRQLTKERDAAREEAGALSAESGVLADVRQDLIRLRDHAADPDNGNAVRGAIAYGVLRDLITRARQERAEAGEDTRLPRPFDLVALVLGLDGDQDDADASAPVREDTAADCMGGTCSCADRGEEAAPANTRECAACGARRPVQDFNHGPICRNCPAMATAGGDAR
ncbi:hypothetical protein ACTVZO_11160 [Streptomyces sp. IBSNAI002]|uniref:hypothetical protein n=1 Tax=Streptomyces sp. IBSNAI002 TaxID=3457500 RepID=UPI003FD53899